MSQGCTCWGPVCEGYLCTVTQRDVLCALQHKAVAQAVWKPEKYKETSHTTCCHYDNQAESFSLISCHSTQHRNPIAFKSYATRPTIRSARLLTHLQKKIHRCTHRIFWLPLCCCILEGAWREFGEQLPLSYMTSFICILVPSNLHAQAQNFCKGFKKVTPNFFFIWICILLKNTRIHIFPHISNNCPNKILVVSENILTFWIAFLRFSLYLVLWSCSWM